MPSQGSKQGVRHSQDTVLVAAGWIHNAWLQLLAPRQPLWAFFFFFSHESFIQLDTKQGALLLWILCMVWMLLFLLFLPFVFFQFCHELCKTRIGRMRLHVWGLSHSKARCPGPVNTHPCRNQGSYQKSLAYTKAQLGATTVCWVQAIRCYSHRIQQCVTCQLEHQTSCCLRSRSTSSLLSPEVTLP